MVAAGRQHLNPASQGCRVREHWERLVGVSRERRRNAEVTHIQWLTSDRERMLPEVMRLSDANWDTVLP